MDKKVESDKKLKRVLIQIPEEMLIHATLDRCHDNREGLLISSDMYDSKIKFDGDKGITIIPNFCVYCTLKR
jgi:hypothetical protein